MLVRFSLIFRGGHKNNSQLQFRSSFNKKFLFILKTCSLFTSQIYRPKAKCKDGGSYFQKNQKHRPLEIEKKIFFSAISFQKFPIFHVCSFSENTHVSSEHSFKTCSFIEKKLQHRCFPVESAKFLRTPMLKNIYF